MLARNLAVAVVLVLCACWEARAVMHGWEECYGEQADEALFTESLFTYVVPTSHGISVPGVKLLANTAIAEGLAMTRGRWTFELWHQESGKKIRYNGPYDVCCGLASESATCFEDGYSDCPMTEWQQFSVTKPLHVGYGNYEATLKIYGAVEAECEQDELCVQKQIGTLLVEDEERTEPEEVERTEPEEVELLCVVAMFKHLPEEWEQIVAEVLTTQEQDTTVDGGLEVEERTHHDKESGVAVESGGEQVLLLG